MLVKNTKDVAKMLEGARAAEGLSKNNLAKQSGMSRPTMLNIIQKGTVRNGYTMDNLLRLAKTLNLEIVIRPK